MNFFDRLTKRNNQEVQLLPLVQGSPNEYGGVDAVVTDWQPSPTMAQRIKTNLADRLFGVAVPPSDNIDTSGETINATISNNPRVGGLLNDITNGARENFATGFAANNLINDTTADGRKKGWAYRIGEGLGTAGRFLESPLGRGLLTAGVVGLTGGNGLQALAYGGQAGTLNQQLRKADNLYRQQLKDNYGFTDDQLNQVKGYINNDTFNSLTKSQNSAMNLALRQQTTESMNKLRALQAEKLRILNSTLPEEQKARLIKLNAEAAHAEEMTLARINYYNNATANPLGWGRLNLAQEQFNYKKEQDAKEAAAEAGLGTPSPFENPAPVMPSDNRGRAF